MKLLSLIPSFIKKFIGWTCSIFLLGWGTYDWVETKLSANNEKVLMGVRQERKLELAPMHTNIEVIKNDVSWIKAYLQRNP